MTTKAELESELEKLRRRNADLEARAAREPDPPPAEARPEAGKGMEEIRRALAEQGIDLSGAEAVGAELVDELGRLHKAYPLTVLLAAFALGYAAGRTQG